MSQDSRIYVAGHRGMVGSALVRKLRAEGFGNIITRSRADLDLTQQQPVADFFSKEKPEYVFLAAAKVGGIWANNTYRGDFIHHNLVIQTNIIHQSYLHGVKRLLFLGSSCIYPKLCPQPIKEEYLMTGPLELTNSPYAIAKIAGVEMCWAYNIQYGTCFIPVMPTNLYGPNDNYDLEGSHVLPAMIRKFHIAKLAQEDNIKALFENEAEYGRIPLAMKAAMGLSHHGQAPSAHGLSAKVCLWGSGAPKREFLHVDDLASGCVFLMLQRYESLLGAAKSPLFNLGTGRDCSIKELAELIQKTVGFSGDVVWDVDKPDGTPRKLLDVSRLSDMGWHSRISLQDGIKQTYEDYLGYLTRHDVMSDQNTVSFKQSVL